MTCTTSNVVTCTPVTTGCVQPVNMLYMGETEISIGGTSFTFGSTELTGTKVVVIVALAAIGVGWWLWDTRHKRRKA
jgi:hypothetical protein